MADKMLRVASRNADGNAKPLQSTVTGELKTQEKTSAYKENFAYSKGSDYIGLIPGVANGGVASKLSNNLDLTALRETSDASAYFQTESPIDLTYISKIFIDYEFSRDSFGPRFKIELIKANDNTKVSLLDSQGILPRELKNFDISAFTGFYSLRISVVSITIGATGNAKIHKIYTEQTDTLTNTRLSQLLIAQRELIETLSINEALKAYYYAEGTEYIGFKSSFVGVLAANTTTAEKNADHLNMVAKRGGSIDAAAEFTTIEPVKLANVDELIVSYELIATTQTKGFVLDLINVLDNSIVASKQTQAPTSEKTNLMLNVSGLNGRYLVRVSVASNTIGATNELKVYGIYGTRKVGV